MGKKKSFLKFTRYDMKIYLYLLPALIITFIFAYIPLSGVLISFIDYDIYKGPFHSSWVGLQNFIQIFRVPNISGSIMNTFTLGVMWLVVGFPAPILLALMFNELRGRAFKRTVQTISYLPYFLSWISVIGIVQNFYSLYGPINDLKVLLFGPNTQRALFLAQQQLFVPNLLLLSLWKETGWGTVIYLAAITGINQDLYEAAAIDGASRMQRIRFITFPGILPVMMMLLILRLGGLFSANFELVYGLQNAFINYEVIPTVVFKYGIQQSHYGVATALGLMQGVVALILTAVANALSKRFSNISIW